MQPDGVYFEQSSYYHRYTTDFYLHLRLLLSANQRGNSSRARSKAHVASGPSDVHHATGWHHAALRRRRRRAINDALASRAQRFSRNAFNRRRDLRTLRITSLFPVEWLKTRCGYLVQRAAARLDLLPAVEPETQSVAFHNGGYYVMRDGWTANANYLLFDCGPHGTMNCGHAHADALSFELAVNGQHSVWSIRERTHTQARRRCATGFAVPTRTTR